MLVASYLVTEKTEPESTQVEVCRSVLMQCFLTNLRALFIKVWILVCVVVANLRHRYEEHHQLLGLFFPFLEGLKTRTSELVSQLLRSYLCILPQSVENLQ